MVYDAEHFFDGYIANPDYALQTLEAAKKAGADVLCLCDTNGGTLTGASRRDLSPKSASASTASSASTPTTIPTVAVANTLAAVEAGATHVQGCMNGYGERCGNANLASVIANLELKLGHTTIGPEQPGEPRVGAAASSPNWPICRCATISRSSARAPSPTRAACTSAPF